MTKTLVGLFTLLASGAALACDSAPDPAHDHRFCGWLYGSRNPAVMSASYDTFAAHAGEMDAVHPTWFHVTAPTTIEARSIGFEDPRVMDHTTARGARTKLVPTIQAEDLPDRAHAHTMLHDSRLRAAHVAAIVRLVTERGYDGVDLDYEHLGSTLRPGETRAAERAAFSAFVAETAKALHARGKVLTLAVPVSGGGAGEIYDYDALSLAADRVHVMGYDFHYEQGPHAGPVAPLGWIRDVVSYIGSIDGGQRKGRFLLALPNYGLVGDSEICAPSTACAGLAGPSYRTTTAHMDGCSMDDGHTDPGRAPNQTLPDGREVFFDDVLSLEEKVGVAEQGGLGGVAYWSIGGEPAGPRTRTFFEMVREHFPAAAGAQGR
jgi:spore germination protein YaaH